MTVVEKHAVPIVAERMRLSDYLAGKLQTIPTKKGIKKAIKNNLVLLNGKVGKTSDWVTSGATIELLQLEKSNKKVFKLGIPVIFEDEHLAIINKPSGYIVSGNQFKTIENALLHNLKPSEELDILEHPQPVHRLDAPTSGLLVIAKTRKARVALGEIFEKRDIQKIYHAIVVGKMEVPVGEINLPIDEKEAITHYKVVDEKETGDGWLSLVELHPQTGRKHQLRKHLASVGHPILGDKTYGEIDELSKGKGLYLCATLLSFVHPILEKRMLTKLPKLPSKFGQFFRLQESVLIYSSKNQ